MDKFIFVCYDHVTGGEALSLEISKRNYCHTLDYTMQDSRTCTQDVFNKFFLEQSVREDWQHQIPTVPTSELYNVVPSHRSPHQLKPLFPNSVYVVINFPNTQAGLEHLRKRVFEKVWLSSHSTIKQKIGICKDNGYDIDSQEKLKQINGAVNNAHIHCIMNNVEFTNANVLRLFELDFDEQTGMQYSDDSQTIALEYNNIDRKKLDRLDELCVLHR